jgi:hypothetical protein
VFFYCKCALNDPVILKTDTPINPEEKTAMLCGECNLEKTKDYKHCFECGLCIHSKEVHCAWIGKCVGKNISSSFQKFNLCWLIYLGFIIFLMGNWSFFNYMSQLFGLHKKNHHKVHNDDYSDDDKYTDDYSIDLSDYSPLFKKAIISRSVAIAEIDLIVGNFILYMKDETLILYKINSVNENTWFTVGHNSQNKVVFYDEDENEQIFCRSLDIDKEFYFKITKDDIISILNRIKERTDSLTDSILIQSDSDSESVPELHIDPELEIREVKKSWFIRFLTFCSGLK